MILVDTSAWVEYDRATASPVDRRLTQLITDQAQIAVTEPVVMEVIAEARNDERATDLRRMLGRFELVPFDAAVDFDAATRIYRACRRVGVTPRGMIDCMIASVAHRSGASMLALDADLARLADVVGITMDEASRLV